MPVSKKQQACVHRYVAQNYDRVNFMVPKGGRDILKEAASLRGMSANAYINAAVGKLLAEDGFTLPPFKSGTDEPENENPEA